MKINDWVQLAARHGGVLLMGVAVALMGFSQNPIDTSGGKESAGDEHADRSVRLLGRAWTKQNSGAPWAVQAEGANRFRFEVRGGDHWMGDDRRHHPAERSEFSDSARLPFRSDVWFAFTMNVEPGSPITSEWVNLAQLRPSTNPQAINLSPFWSHGLDAGGTFRILIRTDYGQTLKKNPPPLRLFEDKEFQRGRDYAFVYHMRYDPKGNGLLDAWRDGVQIVDYKGPFGYTDTVGPYLKFGIYRQPASEDLAVVFKDVAFGLEACRKVKPAHGRACSVRR